MRCRVLRAIAAAALPVLLLSACSSGAASDGSDGPSAQVSASASTVTLASESEKPSEVADTASAHAGDLVSTDADGRAQLDFLDGSLVRLGPDTQLTVVELGSAGAQRTALSLDVGQTWHRVTELVAESARYQVATPVGVAAVRGTAFAVVCTSDGTCTITVIEGSVDFTSSDGDVFKIDPYERLILPDPGGGDPAVTVIAADGVQADEWLAANIGEDGISAEVPLTAVPLAGEWNVTRTFTSVTGILGIPPEMTQSTKWTFSETTCLDVCTFTITMANGATSTATLTDTGFTATGEPVQAGCIQADTGRIAISPYAYTAQIEVTRSTSAQTEGEQFDGTMLFHYVRNGETASPCDASAAEFDEAAELTLTGPN